MDEQKLFPDQPTPEEHLKKQSSQQAAYSSLSQNVTALGSRLRMLEEQYSNIRNKSQLTDRNLLEFEKGLSKEMKALTQDVMDLKKRLQELREKIDNVASELDNAVKEHDFRVLEKYVDLWNPGQFVTREKLKEDIDEILRED